MVPLNYFNSAAALYLSGEVYTAHDECEYNVAPA
jgi:hypothetical protein